MDKFLQNNNIVKVVAVVIAILLWIVVHRDTDPSSANPGSNIKQETIGNVAVTALYDKDQYRIISINPAEVTVFMEWKDNAFRRVSTAHLRVEADLTRLHAGTHEVEVKAAGISTAVSAEVLPRTVRVTIEKIQTKQVPVVIQPTGTPADGYKAGQPVVKPNRVNVSVPESLVDRVASARATLSVEDASSTVTKQVKLTAYDKEGKPVDGAVVNPQVVDVEIPVTSPFKQMPLQIKLNGEPAPGYAIAVYTQDPELVTVYAPQDVLNKMDFYGGLQIDLTGLRETKKETLNIPLKDKVGLLEPAEVNVTIEVVPSVTRTIDNIPVTMIGGNDGFTAKLMPESASVNAAVLEGAPTWMNRLRAQDIQAVVDVSNLAPGIHELPVTLNLPLFIKKPAQTFKAKVEVIAAPGTKPSPGNSGPSASPSPTPVPTPRGGQGSVGAPVTPSPTPASSGSGGAEEVEGGVNPGTGEGSESGTGEGASP